LLTGSEATTRGIGKSGPRGTVQYVWSFREREVDGVVLKLKVVLASALVRLPCEGGLELVLE
jgi:hypothetical protein